MPSLKAHQAGFGAVAAIIIILALLVVAGAGYAVFKKNTSDKKASMATETPSSTKTPMPNPVEPSEQPRNPEGFKKYTNDKYGISFYYSNEWSVEESSNDNSAGPVPVEFSISINANTTYKYRTAALFEVIAKDYQSVTNFYNANYQPSESFKVNKTEGIALGKQSTHWTNTSPNVQPQPARTEHYLFAVGDKTYSLISLNDELNVQRDSDYWNKFNKIRETLQLR